MITEKKMFDNSANPFCSWSKLTAYIAASLTIFGCSSSQNVNAQAVYENPTDNKTTPDPVRVKLEASKFIRLNSPAATASTIGVDNDAIYCNLSLAVGKDGYNDSMDNGKRGKWKLIYDETKIKIWQKPSTSTPWSVVASNTEYGPLVLPKMFSLKVEGVGASASENDVEIKAQLQLTTPAVEAPIEATSKLTVVKVELEKCPNTFIPQGGTQDNEVPIKAKIVPTDVTGKFRFKLNEVSNEKGYALNAPLTVPSSGEDSATWKDLQFPEQTAVVVSGTDRDTAVSDAVNEKSITVKSFDYGAYGKISAKVTLSNGQIFAAWESGGEKEYTSIPLDSNDNHVADGASQNVGPATTFSPTDDNDNIPAGDETDGDRLTRYEEYRGFMVAGVHTRTNTTKKDVFYCDADGVGSQDYWTETNLGAPIHKLSTSELDSTHLVTFNKSSYPGDGQKAINQRMNIDPDDRQFPFGDSTLNKIPFFVTFNSVHADEQKWGIRGGTILKANISDTDTTLTAVLTTIDPGWAASGTLKIGDELITYSSGSSNVTTKTLTFTGLVRGVDGTTAVAHNAGDKVPYFADPEEVIKLVVAHEGGHAVKISHDDSASLMTGSNKAGTSTFVSTFRKTGTKTGSTQEFRVK